MSNWFWIIILLLGSFLLFGTNGPDEVITAPAPPPSHVTINGNPGVILDVSSYRNDQEGWTPDESDLQVAEDAVLAAPKGKREPQIDGYRQYVGIVEDGDRKIVINSMCMHFDNWDETYIEVADGGPCFWGAVYNVETGEIESLVINGEA